MATLAALIGVTLLLAACGSGNQGTAPGKASDTATWAEPASTTPNDIFPFLPASAFSVINGELQHMLYRPLYFFGENGSVGINEQLSLGQLPTYSGSGTTVTIALKSYRWSNGESVNADDVLFWINLYKAEKDNYGGYTPGYFPDNVVSAKAPNPKLVVLTLNRTYNRNWFLYDELSQITPMPAAWDVTGPGQKSDCATVESDCAGVYNYLSAQAKDETSYATSPIWSVVDGPWKLKTFNTDGNASVVPNRAYSGPVKPTLKQVNLAPFTSDSAEFNVLHSGKTLDVGYIPTEDISKPKPKGSSPNAAGPNPLSNYALVPWPSYSFNYFLPNYTNPQYSPIFKQLYFRQALQSTVNQPALITAAAKNYGQPAYGPVPTFPNNPAAPISRDERQNPYPYSISAARKYLKDNGWKVVPGGASTCTRPGTGSGECGAGISAGQKLSFSMIYSTGTQQMTTTMESVKSNASRAGIQITLNPQSFNEVIEVANPCTGSGSTCTWQLADWGGWTYGSPLPTGEVLFQTGALNSGGYSSPQLDKLIRQTIVSNSPTSFTDYENGAAKDLPVFWLPNYTSQLMEVASGLHGVPKTNPLALLDPEYWHY
ncbi:MAG: ABC transporter substrate-binding protein [Candidatus Dormibacteraeota bacterium]|nr:ABC transporter substrate-binding protein [Candidatus Dormibacteraeota bacterium]